MFPTVKEVAISNISIVSRRYQEELASARTSSEPLDNWRGFPGPSLCALLVRDCVPLAQTICVSPKFQQLALWPILRLAAGSETKERRLIERLQQEILRAVADIKGFITEHRQVLDKHFPRAVRRMRVLYAPLPPSSNEHVTLVDRPPPASLPNVQDALSVIKQVEARCREEWVSAQDYFGPRYNTWAETGDNKRLQRWEFIIEYNPELQYVGNFISRCLLVRATTAVRLLETCAKELRVTRVAAKLKAETPYGMSLSQVRKLLNELRDACLHSTDAQLAEAAISMVQIAVGFSETTLDLVWLPSEATENLTLGNVRWALESKRDIDTAQVIGEMLERLRKWVDKRGTDDIARDDAIATGDLVIIEGSREVYWQRQPVRGNWNKCNRQWQLLLILAKSRGLRHVSMGDLYGDKMVNKGAFTRAKNKLVTMLPMRLATAIQSTSSDGELRYRLRLSSDAIHVLKE